jgi:hypothetical protein
VVTYKEIMMTIVIEGLSKRQRDIADRLWGFDTEAQCQRYIATLPSRMIRQEATVVFEMMKWAALDTVMDVGHAAELIRSINQGK